MKAQYITSVLTILSTAAGQTPSGFTPSVDLNLIVTYGSDSISPPGEQLQRSGMQCPKVHFSISH
jgi:hypothetical protein